MAASRDLDNSDLSEVPDLIKCTICLDMLSCPRMLPCLHSFCERCLKLHMESCANNPEERLHFLSTRTFQCPACRETINIPAAGVKGFRRDFRVEQIQDFLKTLPPKPTEDSKAILLNSTDNECGSCWDSVKGTRNHVKYYCLNCKIRFCGDCATRHESSPSFPNHKMKEIGRTLEEGEAEDLKLCLLHTGEQVEFFCLSCNETICVLCTMTFHEKHNITDVQTGLRGFHANATSLCHVMEKRLSQLRTVTKHLNSCEKHLKVLQRDAKKKVKQHAEDLIQSIRNQEQKVLHDLADRCKDNTDRISDIRSEVEGSLVDMDSMFELMKDLTLDKAEVTLTMVPVYREVTNRMENLLKTSNISDIDDLDMTFKFSPSTSKVKLGKILWQEQPVFDLEKNPGCMTSKSVVFGRCNSNMLYFRSFLNKSLRAKNLKVIGKEGSGLGEFHMPRDLCFLSDGRIVVADTGNDRLQVLDSNGCPDDIWCRGQLRPWGVTADIKDVLYVADAMGKCIVVVNKEGIILRNIGKFLCPCGIALTHGQDILVTDFFSPTVYLLDTDGSILNQFDFRRKQDHHTSGASYVSCSLTGKIIISDVSNRCVKVYSLRGTKISKISKKSSHQTQDAEGTKLECCTPLKTKTSFNPQGVASLEYDFLFIDGTDCTVNLYSHAGGFLARFLCGNDSLRGLNGIAVLPQLQRVAMTDVLSHQVALLQPSREDLHSIVGKLPRNVVNPNGDDG